MTQTTITLTAEEETAYSVEYIPPMFDAVVQALSPLIDALPPGVGVVLATKCLAQILAQICAENFSDQSRDMAMLGITDIFNRVLHPENYPEDEVKTPTNEAPTTLQ